MTNRLPIPSELERKIKIEAGHRCAIPTCRHTRLEIAHIVPVSQGGEDSFENLIALCPNCHDLFDKDKKIDRKAIQIYKANLAILNSRYIDTEKRLLELFAQDPDRVYVLVTIGFEVLYHYLIRDGYFRIDTSMPHPRVFVGIEIVFPLAITSEGKKFVQKIRDGEQVI